MSLRDGSAVSLGEPPLAFLLPSYPCGASPFMVFHNRRRAKGGLWRFPSIAGARWQVVLSFRLSYPCERWPVALWYAGRNEDTGSLGLWIVKNAVPPQQTPWSMAQCDVSPPRDCSPRYRNHRRTIPAWRRCHPPGRPQ